MAKWTRRRHLNGREMVLADYGTGRQNLRAVGRRGPHTHALRDEAKRGRTSASLSIRRLSPSGSPMRRLLIVWLLVVAVASTTRAQQPESATHGSIVGTIVTSDQQPLAG